MSLAVLLLLLVAAASDARPPNILHLIADDLRPQLGCYGQSAMHTPNIDALAAKGLQFDFAYTQFSYCAPSRNSFMSGRRPDRTQVLNFLTTFRKTVGKDWVAMPQFFKERGYFTSGAGKVYHDLQDDWKSWSYPSLQTAWVPCVEGDLEDSEKNYCGITNHTLVPFTDEEFAINAGLRRMEYGHLSGKPWWVSIGVHRPHSPYRVPRGFYGTELYPNGTVFPPKNPLPPVGAPYMSGNWAGGDIHDPARGCPNCTVPPERAVEYRAWYYAATTYADHMLGRALDKLRELKCENNTLVIFHSDHGYQLGELNEWSKKTDTEFATHVPMIIYAPWIPQSHGKRTKVKAELVDIYRTLANLTGFGSHVEESVQGTSLEPVFYDVNAMADKVAYSEIGRCDCRHRHGAMECAGSACEKVEVAQFEFIGYTMRTADWRYTAWVGFDNTTMRVDWNRVAGEELYNATADDGRDFDTPAYSYNLASAHPNITSSLRQSLETAVKGWY